MATPDPSLNDMGRHTSLITCPACGLLLPDQGLEPHAGFNASGECWAHYLELTYYTVAKGDPAFIHQYAVDAYAAQHTGENTPPMTTAFALFGLYLATEKQFTGKQVQRVHMALARYKTDWPRLEMPESPGTVTVRDVLDADPGETRDAMLVAWMRSVWQTWEASQGWVRNELKIRLDIEP